MNIFTSLRRKHLVIAVAAGAFILGIFTFTLVRFVTYKTDSVHHHANFALYVNGERDMFDSFTFYEEVQACGGTDADNPKIRTHMHNKEPDVIHVHDGGVTWGHFMANIGYGLTDRALQTDSDVYQDGVGGELSFLLNGEPVETVANRPIGSEDILLINFGEDSDQVLRERYGSIPRSAGGYNGKYDPGGCSGGENLTPWKRLKASLGFGAHMPKDIQTHSH